MRHAAAVCSVFRVSKNVRHAATVCPFPDRLWGRSVPGRRTTMHGITTHTALMAPHATNPQYLPHPANSAKNMVPNGNIRAGSSRTGVCPSGTYAVRMWIYGYIHPVMSQFRTSGPPPQKLRVSQGYRLPPLILWVMWLTPVVAGPILDCGCGSTIGLRKS